MWSSTPRHQLRLVNRRDAFGLRRGAEQRKVEPRRFDLIKAERRSMGTSFELRFAAKTPGAIELATLALDEIDALEAQMTVYSDDSEVSQINATAHRGPVEVDRGLFKLLQDAVDISRLTGGAYDVTSGSLSLAWGFTRGPKRVPTPTELADARDRAGFQHLKLDETKSTIEFDRPGIVINLGSIGKGYALDRAIAIIKNHWWPTSALIHGGHSSLYALGSPPDQFGGRWQVGLRNPFDPEQPLGTIHLRNRGMGTSGDLFQRFEHDGRLYGHILDPRTGQPADTGLASVSVLAPTAAEADALSTAFSLITPAEVAQVLANRPDLGVIFVHQTPTGQQPRVETLNIAGADYTPNVIEPDRPRKFCPTFG